jgi:tyrosine-protein phosphatase SIW14
VRKTAYLSGLVGLALMAALSLSFATRPPQSATTSAGQAVPAAVAPLLQTPAQPDRGTLNAPTGVPTQVAPAWPFSPLSGPSANTPIANFGVVESGVLYRSSQPDQSQMRRLVGEGFQSVVSLRLEAGDQRDYVISQGFGNYLWLAMEDETPPFTFQAEQFLAFVTDQRNWPILMHCKAGLGRTGTLAALVRYAVDGWPMERAIEEARLYRAGSDLTASQMIWLERWAAAHPPGSHRSLLRAAQSAATK